MKNFADFTYRDAAALFTSERRTETARIASLFAAGDAWQHGKGYVGELPAIGTAGYLETVSKIEAGFTSENIIAGVIETHQTGILGREPLWSLLADDGTDQTTEAQETYDPLTNWWNEREVLDDFQRALSLLLLEEIAVKRTFIPRGRLLTQNGDGQSLQFLDLEAALDVIFFETVTADRAGVFTDPDSQYQLGVYLFERATSEAENAPAEKCAELSYLNISGDTILRVISENGESAEFGPYSLGGRLLIHEMRRPALITEAVLSNQRAINLALTMMMRNVNLAGNRDTTVTNAQSPKVKTKIADPTAPGGFREELQDAPHVKGPGAVMYLLGRPIYDPATGKIVGYTNPNVSVSDPVAVTTFTETRDKFFEIILGQCHQTHVLIAGDATASGRSREQARAEFERSLKRTKAVVDAAGRWELEVAVRLSAALSGQSERFINLRADFNTLIDAGEPDNEKRAIVIQLRDAGLISDETARNWIGVEDAFAEAERLKEEAETRRIEGEQPRAPLSVPPAVVGEEAIQ